MPSVPSVPSVPIPVGRGPELRGGAQFWQSISELLYPRVNWYVRSTYGQLCQACQPNWPTLHTRSHQLAISTTTTTLLSRTAECNPFYESSTPHDSRGHWSSRPAITERPILHYHTPHYWTIHYTTLHMPSCGPPQLTSCGSFTHPIHPGALARDRKQPSASPRDTVLYCTYRPSCPSRAVGTGYSVLVLSEAAGSFKKGPGRKGQQGKEENHQPTSAVMAFACSVTLTLISNTAGLRAHLSV